MQAKLLTNGAIAHDISSILGTAPTIAGKLDVKGADGDVFVRQTVGTNLHVVVDAGTANIGDVDVLTVPAPLSTTGNGVAATALRVTVASDSTGRLIADAGTNLNTSLLSLESTQALIKTSVELIDDAVYTDGAGTVVKGLAILGQDGTNPQAIKTDAAGELQVDVLTLPTLPAGVNNIGDVDVLTVPAPLSTTGGGTEAAALRVTLANNSTGLLAIGGDVAHDGVDAGNPVKLGGRAISHGTNPTAVASGDRTNLLANIAGIPFSIGGHPNIVSAEYITTAAQTDDNIMPLIAAGTIYVITGISVLASNANTVNTSVRIGFGAATIPAQGASGADAVTKVILSHPNIAAGSGIVKGNGAGIIGIGGDGEELRLTCSAPTTGSLVVQVDYFTITS